MALAANNFIMAKSNLLALFILVVLSFPSLSYGLTKNFVNTSMPDMRPTFVVNFDMATVICQHSENPEDLHLHEISILCNGKNDCFNNPAMDDESFPYCEGKCNSTCNDRGACLYDGEKAQCYCNSGYHGPSCEITDKNECEDKPCHWLAKCTNTINSTKCDCFAGFKGDGFECTDIDECQSNVANCPEYSQCVNLPGTYFCNCTTGFMPKSALMPTCVDINECELDMHNCADNELCQNTFGSFECVKECSKGYQINGTFCEDVDECLELHQCDKRATCENTNGGYKCICDDGFTGDGHSCSPITDCSKNENICHRHGFCIASLKMCICETGYAGDGLSCHDINECEHPTENPCKDQSDNKCVNIEGGYICCDSKLNDQECIEEKGAYCSGGCGLHAICFNQTCTCVDGFEGDPKVKCNDLNECEDESICPGVGQWCVNMIGGHICCGRDSTHPECKGLEINAFEGNFGKGSISNAQLTEARSRGFFTHIIEKGERQENSSGGVVVVVRGNESDSSGEAIASNGITFTFEVPTCNDNQNTTICPSNSECKQGRCTCTDGFEWSRTSGSCIDLTAIPTDSVSTEILTSGEKGLEISAPFKQGSSTEIPDSGEMGLEISGKSTIGGSEQPGKTTNIVETSTKINLPQTEIENPEDGEHLTQEEIERLKKLKANETSTTTIILTTINPTSTPSSVQTTTEDLSIVKSGEMGLELSGASTLSSAEEFTSEPATAHSSTPESSPTTQTLDSTSVSESTVSATTAETASEKPTKEEEATSTVAASSTPSDETSPAKASPKSHEGSFEKVPKSGEVGLEIGGSDLSGTTQTTTPQSSTTENELTTSIGDSSLLTTVKSPTDTSEETSTEPSSTSSKATEESTVGSELSSTVSVPSELTTTPTSTAGETNTTESEQPSNSITSASPEKSTSSPTEITKEIASSTLATTSGAEEITTIVSSTPALSTPSVEITVETTLSTPSEASSISFESTTIGGNLTETTTLSATEVTDKISEATLNTTPSLTPTTSDEMGLELTGKEFTKTTEAESSSSTVTITKAEATTELSLTTITASSTANETVQTTTVAEPKQSSTAIISNSSPASTLISESTTILSVTGQTSGTTETSEAVTIDNDRSSTTPSAATGTTPSGESLSSTQTTTPEDKTTGSISTSATEQISTFEASTISSPAATETSVPKSTELTTPENTESTFVPDKIITTGSVTGSLTSEIPTTVSSTPETPVTSVAPTTETPTTKISSTETSSSTAGGSTIQEQTIETSATTEGDLSTSSSTPEPTSSPTEQVQSSTVDITPSTESSISSSEPSPTSVESEAITPTFEQTYATFEASTVSSSTEASVTDTLPTSETLSPAVTETIVATTESSATEKEQTSTALPAETTFGITASESPIDFTTIKSLEITTEQLPPVVIVDKSRSHEEVDENSQQRITSTANPVTDSTEAETSPLSKTKCLSNDECENDSYCERRSGVCSCKPGFDGEPPQQSCQDIDECKQNLDDCHSSSRCLNYNGGYHCVCAIGYRKNANGVCEDIDECIASNGTICDSHAICRNLPGAYLCECNAGYTGDGYNCISIEKRHCNQNEWAKSDCGRNHFCLVDGNGKIDCDVCKNGFIMKNGICSDINECDENQKLCHTDAICQNIMGGYQCRCQPGYAGDGHNCQDIDECGIQNSCHPQATCVNAPGSFMCECPEGWTGDGKNACLNPADQKCSQRSQVCLNGRSNSACLSLKVGESFESACECLPNYRYNSTTLSCEDIDECAENRDNCDTANTVCVNTIGGFQCHCAAGYEGSGGICSDIDECKRGLAGCHVNAHCINRIGGVECRCGAGYTGDGTDCFPLDNRQVGGSDCSDDWVNMCRSRNKTCHIDDEEVPQCGSCMFGYQPMDGKCQPINALGNCADPSKNDCDANAECIDVRPGRHFCSCKIGFIGDGMHCDDVDECSIPRLCDFHAVCKNTNGSYECQCKEGFIGNGFKCVPANQSQNCRISPEICHTHAGCQPDGTCKCLRGYEGDGVTDCKRTSVTDGYDEGETSTSRRPYFTTEAFFTSTTTDRHCSARDRTACHVLATCDLDLGECVCRQGFMGDGYIACTRIWEDCTTDKTMCHTNATCDSETKQCQCNLGFIGDGVSCVPDKMDCIIRPNLCSEMAECVARRCVCGPGFTGDGSICMPVEPPQFIAGNCSLCHIQAICANGGCRCGQGCFGNGALCVPDPEDCLNYPGVCHMNGICDATSRRCSCKKGFSGNGLDCSKRISCHTDPSICHKDATCLSDGRCECNHGLIGDGVECLKPLTAAEIFGTSAPQLIHFECPSSCGSNAECINGACKCLTGYIADENSVCTDIDECKMLTAQCHPHAECINQEGTYECRCLAGYSGSGKECSTAVLDNPDGLKVECKDDGLDVVLVEETSSFNGRIFVRGQSENPYCTKTFNGSEALPLAFHVPIAHCDMQLEENDTLAVTVIIQKHPLFVTEQAYAYRLKCTYPTATRNIMSHYNVSEITTVETINTKGVEPACQLTVTNERNVTIDSAIVGQVLKLALFVLPNDSFTVLPRNCYAINLETSQRYTLTDEAGCAIDAQLFPEWTRINPSLTHATFRTFKWPDSSMIRFECDCSACVADCPVINCERRREEQKAKLRFARDEGAVGTSENQDALWLKNSPSNIKPATSAFSAVVVVMDDAEEQLAQKQVEEWLYKGSLHESEFFSNLDEDRICVSAPWAILCLFSIIISISLLLTMTQIYKRRISKKKAELQHRATNFYDNNSAYIKF